MKKIYSDLLLIGAVLASLGGFAAFIFLFIPDFNIYWLILSPVIIACYQIPAAGLFWYYKRAKRKISPEAEQEPEEEIYD